MAFSADQLLEKVNTCLLYTSQPTVLNFPVKLIYHNDELYSVYKFDWEIQNGWLYLYYSDSYTFIIDVYKRQSPYTSR